MPRALAAPGWPARLLALGVTVGAISTPASALAEPAGQAVFARSCAACHQLTGKGVPGAFPALDGDPIVRGSPPVLAALLLHGRGGMPSFRSDLNDDEISAVLTYVRQAWSNREGPVAPPIVATARGGGAPPPSHTPQAH